MSHNLMLHSESLCCGQQRVVRRSAHASWICRVSTHDQTLALQQDELNRDGCERLFTDTASGAKADRPGLDEAVGFARSGDTLVVWKLDRVGRSLPHLIETISGLRERGTGFKSLTELDQSSKRRAMGRVRPLLVEILSGGGPRQKPGARL